MDYTTTGPGGSPELKTLRVFAPNGETTTVKGCAGVLSREGSAAIEVFIKTGGRDPRILRINRKAVIQDLKTGEVLYNPRVLLGSYIVRGLTKADVRWLRDNPHWPALLELDDDPVESGEGGGLYDPPAGVE